MRVFEKCAFIRVALNKLGSSSNKIYIRDLECLGPLVAASLALGPLQRAGPQHSKSRRFHGLAV